MKKLFLILATFSFLFSGCCKICKENNNNKKENIITNADYSINTGQVVTIELKSNPTTGYSWNWTNRDAVKNVDTIGWKYLSESNLMGGGGKDFWSFKGLKKGIDTIQIDYKRVWEKDIPPVETKKIIIEVK